MRILGIETSCDETSASVINIDTNSKKITVLSNIIATSLTLHAKTGGIIPEIAAREQIRYIIPVIDKALQEAGSSHIIPNIDAIAVTFGPGLIGSLLVGVETAKTLSCIWNKPLLPVNHLFGHIYANWISLGSSPITIPFPILALIVSGGHTDLVVLQEHGSLKWISGTRDDAAGEAFDKIGRLLGLTYPAGPIIEHLAKQGAPNTFRFPRPLIHENTLDFSFSGLKTAVLREVQAIDKKTSQPLNKQTIANLAKGTQEAIIDVLINKTLRAAEQFEISSIVLSGGVSANKTLTEQFKIEIENKKLPYHFFVPPAYLCTDNAAMIAAAGFFNYHEVTWHQVTANPELYFD